MVHVIFNDPRIAGIVAFATTAIGASSWLKWIPDDVGKLASAAGIILTSVLVYRHWRTGRREQRKLDLEIEILERKNERET